MARSVTVNHGVTGLVSAAYASLASERTPSDRDPEVLDRRVEAECPLAGGIHADAVGRRSWVRELERSNQQVLFGGIGLKPGLARPVLSVGRPNRHRRRRGLLRTRLGCE